MICMPAWRYGAALSITVGLLYIGCAIVAMVFPDAIARVLTTVVHGLNISGLTGSLPTTSAGAVVVGLVYILAYSFVAGWLFGAIRNRFARSAA